MPFELWVKTTDPCDLIHVRTYDSQALARWWAINMAERGSVGLHVDEEIERLIPVHRIKSFFIKETS